MLRTTSQANLLQAKIISRCQKTYSSQLLVCILIPTWLFDTYYPDPLAGTTCSTTQRLYSTSRLLWQTQWVACLSWLHLFGLTHYALSSIQYRDINQKDSSKKHRSRVAEQVSQVARSLHIQSVGYYLGIKKLAADFKMIKERGFHRGNTLQTDCCQGNTC